MGWVEAVLAPRSTGIGRSKGCSVLGSGTDDAAVAAVDPVGVGPP